MFVALLVKADGSYRAVGIGDSRCRAGKDARRSFSKTWVPAEVDRLCESLRYEPCTLEKAKRIANGETSWP